MTTRNKIFENLRLSIEEIFRIEDATVNNELISTFYETINQPEKAKHIKTCGHGLVFDEFVMQRVFDLKKVLLCKDMFCINCQRYKSKLKFIKYYPALQKVQETHDLYMLTLTVPNCADHEYNALVDKMYKCFKTLTRYFSGNAKIKNVDFSYLDYQGCIRSFETTFNLSKRDIGEEFHPHFHVMIALSKDIILDRNTINDFSYSYKTVYENGKKTRRKTTRLFCDLELTIQKIWYLLINNEKVTASSIRNAPGYSCTLDKADDKVMAEVFKYSIKSFDENQQHIDFIQFKTLYYALTGRRMIDGYGVFRDVKDTFDPEVDNEIITELHDAVISALHLTEKPQFNVYKALGDVKHDLLNGECIHINKRALFSATYDKYQEITELTTDLLHDYNQTHRRKISIDEFYENVRKRAFDRKFLFEFAKKQKQETEKYIRERSKSRLKYVREQLKILNIDRKSSLYASTVLSLKVKWNNEHSLSATNAPLPF